MNKLNVIILLLMLSVAVSCEKHEEPIVTDDVVESNISGISWFGDSRKVQSYVGGEITLYFSVNTVDGKAPNGEVDLESLAIYSGGIKTKALPAECEGLEIVDATYDTEKKVLEVLVSVDSNVTGSGETYLEYRGFMRSDGFELYISDLKLEDFADPNLTMAFNEWIIVDESADSKDFESLRDRLDSMTSSVDLSFPYLKAVPKKALYDTENISSISLPVAITIGEKAFYSEDFDTTLTLLLPKADEASLLDGTIYPEELSLVNLTVGEDIKVSGNSVVKVENGGIVNIVGSFASLVGGKSDESLAPVYQEIAYSDISEDNYPDGDYWSVTGCTTLEYGNNINEALFDANDKCRKISLRIENLTTLGDMAFRGTYTSALSSISLPEATIIGDSAFEFCRNLESVDLPNVTTLGDYAFHSCEKLDDLSLPKLESLGVSPFSVTGALRGLELNPSLFSLADGVVYNKEVTQILGAYNVAKSYTAPSTVATVRELSFLFCRELETLTLPAVVTVGDRAFSDCRSLTSLSLPQLERLGDSALENCTSLVSMEVNPAYFTFEDNTLYNRDKSTIIKVIKGYEWYEAPSSVTTIAASAFKSLDGMTYVVLPEVTTVEGEAFAYCESLALFSAPKAITLAEGALCGCDLLEVVELGELQTVGKEAFSNCGGLVEISLPKVTSVGSRAFFWCSALESVVLPSAVLIGDEAFLLSRAITSLEVASASGVTYSQNTENWRVSDKENTTLTTNSINQGVFSSWGYKEVVLAE